MVPGVCGGAQLPGVCGTLCKSGPPSGPSVTPLLSNVVGTWASALSYAKKHSPVSTSETAFFRHPSSLLPPRLLGSAIHVPGDCSWEVQGNGTLPTWI